jgi:hypothetical protein
MKELYIPADELPHSFFDALEISWQEIAFNMIKIRFPNLKEEECELFLDKNYELLHDGLLELRDSDSIQDYWIGEDERDGTMGTWGWAMFEIEDTNKAKMNCEKEIESMINSLLNKI